MKNKLLAILAAGLLAGPISVRAAIVTYDFSVTATSGGLSGATGNGYFSYDDSIVPSGGGRAALSQLFESFHFTWNTINYDESSINSSGNLYFAADGTLNHFVFGPSCQFDLSGQASCLLNTSSSSDDWIVTDAAFLYSYNYDQCLNFDCTRVNGSGSGTTSFQLQTTSVPEPGTLALCGIAIMVLGSSRRRRAR